MILDYNNEELEEIKKKNFRKQLEWFEQEFDEIFQRDIEPSPYDVKIAGAFLNKLSESINQCEDENLLYELSSTLNKIEEKHKKLFNEVI